MMSRTITIIISFLCLANTLQAGRDDIRFFGYGTSDGISVGKVRKIFQDSKGFLWLATEDGLNRFDGYTFEVFRNKQHDSASISSNKIYDIAQDQYNRLWIATGYGLNSYNLVTGKFRHYTSSNTSGQIKDDEIRSLLIYNDSLLYFGTHKSGLQRMNLHTHQIHTIDLPGKPKFIRTLEYADESLLIGTSGQSFYRYNLLTKKTRHTVLDKNSNRTFVNQINAFLPVNKHTKWIATENGIFQCNTQTHNIKEITPRHLFPSNKNIIRVRDLIKDRDDIIWATTDQGLLKYQKNHWKIYTHNKDNQYSLRSNWLVDLFEDESGSIWISNKENGINVIHNKKQKFIHYGSGSNQQELSNNLVFSFDRYDTNEILIGTIGGGLDSFNPQTEKFYNYNRYHAELGKKITAIKTIDYNKILLGTWGKGLQIFNPKTGGLKTFTKNKISNNTIICIHPAKNKNYWIGTFDGLNYFNSKTHKFKKYTDIKGLESHTIFYIYQTSPDTLWAGTRGGGLAKILHPHTDSMQAVSYLHNTQDTSSIPSNVVKFIHEDHNGYFWIATEMGISRFDSNTEQFRNYNIADGLPNNNIWAILPDKQHNLWLSTNSGIAKIQLDSASNITNIRSYKTNEGLRSLEFSQGAYLNDKTTGNLYFGGTEGFYMFNPQDIKPRQYEPPVHITSIKIMDKEYKADTLPSSIQTITIPWKKNFISFEFAGLDYAHQRNILYKYKMIGQNNKWSRPSTRRFASFPDLKDGSYIFKVKSTNSEGIWSNNPPKTIKINITVTPPWWRTKIAYFLYVMITIVSILIYIQIRTRKLKKEKRILENIVEERTAELRKKNKDITSSIQYAQRIQQAIIFPSIKEFSDEFKKVFVLFKPKDIVSGDFFWYIKKGKTNIFTAADCTGHGVPGAFMSIIGNNLLNQIVAEENITDPAQILTKLDERIKQALHQKGRKSDMFDGMDIALCAIDEDSNQLKFSGAHNPLYHIRDDKLVKYKPTRKSIGGSQLKEHKQFFTHTIPIKYGDTIYIFSDGYADQFGGIKDKKFTSRQLQEKLIEIQHENMPKQHIFMDRIIEEWMENYEQIDDMILVGVRF